MSDPSAINLPVNVALTSDMMLGLKPSAPKSRSYRLNVSPLNKSIFVGLDQVIIEIPNWPILFEIFRSMCPNCWFSCGW